MIVVTSSAYLNLQQTLVIFVTGEDRAIREANAVVARLINRPITTSSLSSCPHNADRSIWVGSDERE
jgi:hypothetical protein